MGALPKFGAALGCHLGQAPYYGNTLVCRLYLPHNNSAEGDEAFMILDLWYSKE
jgi:hypothetical protein